MKTRYFENVRVKCDVCACDCGDTYYDMPFRGGTWANLCNTCRQAADNPTNPMGFKFIRGKNPKASKPSGDKRKAEMEHAHGLSADELENMFFDGDVETCDGCIVEPDGKCPHGFRSPLLVLGHM